MDGQCKGICPRGPYLESFDLLIVVWCCGEQHLRSKRASVCGEASLVDLLQSLQEDIRGWRFPYHRGRALPCHLDNITGQTQCCVDEAG